MITMPNLAASLALQEPIRPQWTRMDTLKKILNDGFIIELTLDFLYRLNNTDFLILQNLIPDQRNSILHNAAVIAHSFMNACTTRDSFLRDNMEWIRKAKHWAQFTATASIGVVHRGVGAGGGFCRTWIGHQCHAPSTECRGGSGVWCVALSGDRL